MVIVLMFAVVVAAPPPETEQREAFVAETRAVKAAEIRLLSSLNEVDIKRAPAERSKATGRLAGHGQSWREQAKSLLSSSDDDDRTAAMAYALATEWHGPDVIDAVIRGYDPASGFLARHYAALLVGGEEAKNIRKHSAGLARLMRSEGDERIRLSWMAAALSLAEEDARAVMLEYVKTGSPVLQNFVLSIARGRGGGVEEGILKDLERAGAADVLGACEVVRQQVTEKDEQLRAEDAKRRSAPPR